MAEFTTSTDGNIHILSVAGRLDPQSGSDLKQVLDSMTQGDLVVDLEHLEYIASSGFRELFIAGKTISRNGHRMVVCGLQGEVRRIFEVAGFAVVYPILDTRADAIEHLRTKA